MQKKSEGPSIGRRRKLSPDPTRDGPPFRADISYRGRTVLRLVPRLRFIPMRAQPEVALLTGRQDHRHGLLMDQLDDCISPRSSGSRRSDAGRVPDRRIREQRSKISPRPAPPRSASSSAMAPANSVSALRGRASPLRLNDLTDLARSARGRAKRPGFNRGRSC